MKKYNGKWVDCFNAREYTDENRPDKSEKILFETPHVDYLFDKSQWEEFKKKINEV